MLTDLCHTLTNYSCCDESSWTYCIFFWAVGLLKDICSLAEKYCGPKDCCGIWGLVRLMQVTWSTSVPKNRIWFDLIWWPQFCVSIKQYNPCMCIDQHLSAGNNLFLKLLFLSTAYIIKNPNSPWRDWRKIYNPFGSRGLCLSVRAHAISGPKIL